MCDQVEGQWRIRPAHPAIVRFPIERYPGVLEELRRPSRSTSAMSESAATSRRTRRGLARFHVPGQSAAGG
jgi:hypothetical protein